MQRAKHYWVLVLICLSLSCSAARSTFAAGGSFQLIPTSLTVTCQQEQRITFVSASSIAQDKTTLRALGLAITSTKALEDSKIFCVYWFTTARGLAKKRDDDSGKLPPTTTGSLLSYNREVISRFFQKLNCPLDSPVINAIIDVIDKADPSVADGITAQAFVKALSNKGLLTDSSPQAKDQALGPFENFSNELEVARVLHQSIVQWLSAAPALETAPDASAPPPTAPNPTPDAGKESAQALKSVQRSLLILVILGAVFIALMIGACALLFFYLRKKQFDAFEPLYHRLRKNDEATNASNHLSEIIERHETEAKNRATRVGGAEKIYEGLLKDVKQFWSEWLFNSNDKQDLIAAKQQIANYIELPSQADKPISETISHLIKSVDENLEALLRPDKPSPDAARTEPTKPLPSRLGEIRNLVDEMWRYYRDLGGVQATGTEAKPGSSAGRTEDSGDAASQGRLRQIERAWLEMLEVYQLFIGIGRPEDTIDFAKESVELLSFYQEKFQFKNIEQGAIQQRIEQEATAYQEIRTALNTLKTDLPKEFQPAEDSPAAILQAARNGLEQYRNDLSTSQGKLGAYEQGVTSLSAYFPGKDVFVAAEALATDCQQAVESLASFYSTPNDQAGIVEMARTAQLQLTSATGYLQRVFKGETGPMDEMVGRLVTKYEEIEPQAAEAQDWKEKYEERDKAYGTLTALNSDNTMLAEGLLQSLDIKYTATPEGARRIHVKTMPDQPYIRQLRLGLLAALPGWDEAIDRIFGKGRANVLTTLQLSRTEQREGVRDKLASLLTTIEECPDRELWTKVLHPGFGGAEGGWIHRLFRAETLLQTYFSGNKVFSDFKDIVSQSATSIRRIMRFLNVELIPVTLLEMPPKDVECRYGEYSDLVELDEVQRKVKQRIKHGIGFVVDVIGFPFEATPETPKFKGELVLVTAARWPADERGETS